MTAELDKLDLKILKQLQMDCSQSTTEIADKVGLSQSPCWRRIQRLRDEGFIRANVALIDRSKFGESMYIFAHLVMDRLTDEERERFLMRIEDIPEIVEAYTLFGEMDVMLKVLAPDMNWYQNFTFRTILRLPGVRNVRSTASLSELKNTTQLPLPTL